MSAKFFAKEQRNPANFAVYSWGSLWLMLYFLSKLLNVKFINQVLYYLCSLFPVYTNLKLTEELGIYNNQATLPVRIKYKISTFGHNHKHAHKIVGIFVMLNKALLFIGVDNVPFHKFFKC